MYEINEKNDSLTGVELVVNVPQGDIDKKALYTLLSDLPDFILPFNYRMVDGLCEFTYHIGNCNKMSYLSNTRNAFDYLEMWQSLVKPLLDCGDWFMKTFSFVLQYDYIYFDKNSNVSKYIYIPTLVDCSDHSSFRTMIMDVVKQNRATDVALENKVLLWALQDSKPQDFFDVVTISKATQESAYPALTVVRDEDGEQNMQYQSAAEYSIAQLHPKDTDISSTATDSKDADLIVIKPNNRKVKKNSFFDRFKRKKVLEAESNPG